MKAILSNFKQSPRKVRLVADMIRGKRVMVAHDLLTFTPKKSSPEIAKLLNSAIANARTQGQNVEDLIVAKISVDKGTVLRRFKPMARGRAARIHRTMSIIRLELGTKQVSGVREQVSVKKEKKEKEIESVKPTESKPKARKTTKKSNPKP